MLRYSEMHFAYGETCENRLTETGTGGRFKYMEGDHADTEGTVTQHIWRYCDVIRLRN